MRTVLFLCLLITALALPLGAQELLVEYLEGTLELSEGGRWVELYIGDTLPPNSRIRLGDNGFAELSRGSVTVNLSEDGLYDTGELFKAGQKVAAWNLGTMVNSKLSKLISGGPAGQTAAMGVRGEAKDPQDITWVEDTTDYLEEGKELLVARRLDEAIRKLEDGAESALTDDERNEYLFYAAYGHSLKGESAVSLIMLEDMNLNSTADFFTDYVLLKGKLLIDSLAFEEALELFAVYLKHPDAGETTQVVHYLAAVCYQGLDNMTRARQSLEAAYEIDPASDYGRAASRMMDSL